MKEIGGSRELDDVLRRRSPSYRCWVFASVMRGGLQSSLWKLNGIYSQTSFFLEQVMERTVDRRFSSLEMISLRDLELVGLDPSCFFSTL